MNQKTDQLAYGIAAFALVELLVIKLLEKHLLSESDVLDVFDGVAKSAARKGLAGNDETETSASLLASNLAVSLRRRH